MKTSKKKINAGDTLTVGDLTDDYRGAVIEVGTLVDITYTFTLGSLGDDWYSQKSLWTPKVRVGGFYPNTQVKVITPPPAVQPDKPTIIGQLVRFEGDDDWLGVVVDLPGVICRVRDTDGCWWYWDLILERAGDRQIIVSDPPRWPDETPEVPERIEEGEWPDDDKHLRGWAWVDHGGDLWRYDPDSAGWVFSKSPWQKPVVGPWTRGNRVEEPDARVA